MPDIKRPRRGSRGYYPKKRAKRIYPRVSYPKIKELKTLGFAGYKAGMTHVSLIDTNPNSKTKNQIITKPVSIIECPPLTVFGFRCYKETHNGLTTFKDAFSENIEKNLKRKVKIKPKKLDIKEEISEVRLLCHTNPPFKKKPEVFEIGISGKPEEQLEHVKQLLGKQIKISDIFKEGDIIDTSAVTKGKGFSGPVKRFGIKLHGRKAKKMHRHVGSLGPENVAKIRSEVPAAGQLGFQTRTELNKRILKIAKPEEVNIKGDFLNYGVIKNESIILEGSIPGPRKRLIMLRFAMRPPKTRYPVDLKYISLESKQGV